MGRQRRKPTEVESKLTEVLRRRESLATSEDELKELSGLSASSFKEALIRLVEHGIVFKWKTENYINYIVLSEFAPTAYYEEAVSIDPLYAAFGHLSTLVTVRRSVPFVILEDEDTKKVRHNRYANCVA